MTEHEYTRLKGLLNAVAEIQKTVARNMLNAEKRFAFTEKGIDDLLNDLKKRRRKR